MMSIFTLKTSTALSFHVDEFSRYSPSSTWSLFIELGLASLSPHHWLFSTGLSSFFLILPPFLGQPTIVTASGVCNCCSFCLMHSGSHVWRHAVPRQGDFSGHVTPYPVSLLVSFVVLITLGTHLYYLFVPLSLSACLPKNKRCVRAGTLYVLFIAVFPVSGLAH